MGKPLSRSAERRGKSIRSFDFSAKTDCQEITEQTIDVYKPTHILFVTGWDDWLYYRTDRKRGIISNVCLTVFPKLK